MYFFKTAYRKKPRFHFKCTTPSSYRVPKNSNDDPNQTPIPIVPPQDFNSSDDFNQSLPNVPSWALPFQKSLNQLEQQFRQQEERLNADQALITELVATINHLNITIVELQYKPPGSLPPTEPSTPILSSPSPISSILSRTPVSVEPNIDASPLQKSLSIDVEPPHNTDPKTPTILITPFAPIEPIEPIEPSTPTTLIAPTTPTKPIAPATPAIPIAPTSQTSTATVSTTTTIPAIPMAPFVPIAFAFPPKDTSPTATISVHPTPSRASLPPVTESSPYTFTYISLRFRMGQNDIRNYLNDHNIRSSWIIDIMLPMRGIVGLLTHTAYTTTLRSQLAALDLRIVDFDPCSPNTVENPRFDHLTHNQRRQIASRLHSSKCMKGLVEMSPVLRQSVANDYFNKGYISQGQYDELLTYDPYFIDVSPKLQQLVDSF